MPSLLAMSGKPTANPSRRAEILIQRAAWAVLALTILVVVIARVRLRAMPLERDEGEYAYAGQLMLEGVPPYKLAYNMKLPGTYAAYAVMMGVFGQSPAGIHLGLTVVNVATIVLMFFLGRRLLDAVTGAVAALGYGLLSTSPSLMGTAGHATHFVALFAVGGAWLLLRASETERRRDFFLTGLLFGLAFLMKQPGLAFGVFAVAYVAWRNFANKEFQLERCLTQTGLVFAGLALPYALTCVWLWHAGVLKAFIFWTVGYARQYVSALPWSLLRTSLHVAGEFTLLPTVAFWILAGVGAVLMWWERRLAGRHFFLLGLVFASIAATAAGLYFRPHYFITMLPALTLLCGVAVSRSVDQLLREKSVELFSALGVQVLFFVVIVVAFVEDGDDWFGREPRKVGQAIYGTTLFSESQTVADYIRQNFPKDARVAVIGSEPQIYFLAGRRSATGYIYTYGLMGKHQFARPMQDEMIREIESARPECVVYVENRYSWAKSPGTDERIFDWWKDYWAAHYDLARTVTVTDGNPKENDALPEAAASYFLILKRKSDDRSK